MKKIRQLLKSSDTILGFRNDLLKLQRIFRWRYSSKALRKYIKANQLRKLQIGAGPIALPGWLGTDLRPDESVAFLDATKPFPIEDCAFDYVHTEHMIEHITWFEGLAMLKECRRILKPGGTIRVATPDLRVIANLYNHSSGSPAEKYIKTITDLYLQGISAYQPGFIINSAFFRWGHKFVYDGELLEMALQETGFVDIKRYQAGESDDYNLRGVEMHGRIGNNQEDLNQFETMVFEGKRPN